MNVEDVVIDYNQFKGQDLLEVVWEKQKTLMNLYGVPRIDLDVPKDQQMIRAMAWSVVEEAGEAMEAYDHKHYGHIGDELADMMHFFVELLIMSGVKHEDIYKQLDLESWKQGSEMPHELTDFEHMDQYFKLMHPVNGDKILKHFHDFIVKLALAVNVLKNRFWRETNLKTDHAYYHHSLRQTYVHFFHFCNALGFNPAELVDYYLKKNEVNLFRIRSKY